MIGWLVLAAYIAGWVHYTRRFAVRFLEGIERDWPMLPLDNGDRWFSLWSGAGLAIIWPVAAPIHHMRFSLIGGIRTRQEIMAEKDAELVKLRKLAKDYNLPHARDRQQGGTVTDAPHSPKPPADTSWITMTEQRDGPRSAAIYGVALLSAACILVLAVLLW